MTNIVPKNTFISKVYRYSKNLIHSSWKSYLDRKNCTYSNYNIKSDLSTRLTDVAIYKCTELNRAYVHAIKNYMDHKFDLLGSGWINVGYATTPRGIENIVFSQQVEITPDQEGDWLKGYINSTNASISIEIWRKIKYPYRPIDWQLDFKSGYRWKQKSHSFDINPLGPLGTDIKVPWELARMQHLPQMALYSIACNHNDSEIDPNLLQQEFHNQILDFIATNPPRYGVNWVCSMDVAIRAANWLIAYDLFYSAKVKFDTTFQEYFTCSIYEHGKHIVENLEWTTIARGNHYLANIVGLIFISSYLPNDPEINSWLAFSIQEYIKEVSRQFHTDGSNFEASTSYHRLSTQMIIYGAAVLSNLPQEKQQALSKLDSSLWKYKPSLDSNKIKFYNFRNHAQLTPIPDWLYDRIENAATFTNDITKPNGLVPMIGDNDSGYFTKLLPNYLLSNNKEWNNKYATPSSNDVENDTFLVDEEQRDHKHILHEVSGLFGQSISQDLNYETLVIALLSGHKDCKYIYNPQLDKNKTIELDDKKIWCDFESMKDFKENKCITYKIQFPSKINMDNVILQSYSGMGIYIFKTQDLYLLIRCGEIGQDGIGGHAHNDQLSFELNYAGEDIVVDPGTYLYTPFPELRNKYRSVAAHFSPQIHGEEPSDLNTGLFTLNNAVAGICLYFGKKGFIGMHKGYSNPIYRKFEIRNDHILITDISKNKNLLKIEYSPPLTASRYGMQLRQIQKCCSSISSAVTHA